MRISASDFILFCNDPLDNIRKLSEIVPEVEVMIDGDAWDDSESGWHKLSARIRGCGVPLTVHPPAWDVNAAAPIATLRRAAQILNAKSAEFCGAIGGSQVVFHPGYYDSESNFSRTRAIDHCFESLDSLVRVAKPLGLTVAFENIASPSSALFTQEEFAVALNGVDGCVKYLLDVGHANMNAWDIPKTVEAIADRLCAFHLHDNDGRGDAHQTICTGTIDWTNTFAAMREVSEDCVYILEYAAGTPLETLARGRDILLDNVAK